MNELLLGMNESAKTEYIEAVISRAVSDGGEALVVVPEQYTLTTEKRLISVFGEQKMNNIPIVSFKRLCRMVFSQTGARKYNFIGKGGKSALMMKAVAETSPFLRYYPEGYRPLSFVNLISSAVSELKISGISPEELSKTAAVEQNDKLYDIALFASAYDSLFSDGDFDADDSLACLSSAILSSRLYDGKNVIFTGFSIFLSAEADVICALAATGAKITAALPCPSASEPKYSLFSVISKCASSLCAKMTKVGTPFEFKQFTDGCSALPCDLEAVNKYLYRDGEYTGDVENVSIYKASGLLDEVEMIAAKITAMVRDDGYRYDDFVVVTRESEPYSSVLEPVFSKYGIPLFVHRRVPLRIKPLSVLIDTLFSIIRDGYRREYVLSFLKTGLTEPKTDDIALFESYVEKWHISYNRFLRDFPTPADGDNGETERINSVRRYVTGKVEAFRQAIKGANIRKTAEALYGFFGSVSLGETLAASADEYAKCGESALFAEQQQVYELTIDALDELVKAAGDDYVPPDEFRELLFSVIEENDIGIIPTALDEVMTGSIDSVPLASPRVAFVAGLSDGSFPKTAQGFSLFDDNDKMLLEKHELTLGKTEEESLIHEQYLVYRAFSAPTEKLFLSYCGGSGGDARPSSAIAEITRVLSSLTEKRAPTATSPEAICERIQNDASAFNIYSRFGSNVLKDYLENTPYKRFMTRKEETELTKNTASALFGKNMTLSASRVAKYYECGFSYYCEYGLGLKQRRDRMLGALETGNFMHFILQRAVSDNIGDDDEIKLTAERLSTEYLHSVFGDGELPAGFMTYFGRLVEKSERLLKILRDELSQSKFVPVDFELNISDSGKIKPVVIPFEGGSVRLVGVIDRVDVYEKDGRKYIRVVDYKSGSKSFDLQYVYYGLDVQMLMYLCALGENGKNIYGETIPAGCMYVGANPKIVSVEKDEGLYEAERLLLEKQPRSGLFLDNTDVLRAMDAELSGTYIPVKINSKSPPLATEEEFGKLFFHIQKLLSEMARCLLDGKTEKNPVKTKSKDSCDYCVYKPYCMDNGTRRGMEKIGFDNIYKKIEDENDLR